MRVLVTGAGGFIGRALVPQLLAEGWFVRAHVRKAPVDLPEAERMETMPGELPSRPLSDALCKDMDAVIHLAGLAHVSSSETELRRHNVEATLELAHAARAHGVRRFIFLSSTKANYPSHSAYGRLKAEAESLLLALGSDSFEVICLRPALVYGPGMRGNLRALLKLLRRPFLPVFIASKQRIGMIGVQDLARAIALVVKSEGLAGRILELHDGQRYTLDEIGRAVRHQLGYAEPWLALPGPLLKPVAIAAEIFAPVHRTSFSLSTYRTLFEENYAGDETFFKLTRFRPEASFYTELPRLLEDLRGRD